MLVLIMINQTSITIFRCIAAIFRAVVLANVMAFVYIVRAFVAYMLCLSAGVRVDPWQTP